MIFRAAFVTTQSGDGKYAVHIRCRTLGDMHRWHDAVLDACRASLAPDRLRTEAEPVDPEAEEQFQNGIAYALTALAGQLDAVGWTIQDGTETLEGDVAGTIIDILRKGGVFDEDNARSEAEPVRVTDEMVERACEEAGWLAEPDTAEREGGVPIDALAAEEINKASRLAMRDILEAALKGGDEAEPVRVKVLEWRTSTKRNDWHSETPVGRYDIGVVGADYMAVRRTGDSDTVVADHCATPADAMTAAQADFETLIRSALALEGER